MKNNLTFLLIISLALVLSGCTAKDTGTSSTNPDEVSYSCQSDADCTSTCGEGCVNSEWKEGYEDTCINVRAYDCTCVDNQCNTDGQAPVDDQEVVEDDGTIEVAGGYEYFLKPDKIFAAYTQTAINRLCFVPAQLESANEGNMFCFSNTEEALEVIGLTEIDQTCAKYWNVAKVKIRNLTNKDIPTTKSDQCVESGSCLFNEAELVSVVESHYDAPKCDK